MDTKESYLKVCYGIPGSKVFLCLLHTASNGDTAEGQQLPHRLYAPTEIPLPHIDNALLYQSTGL